MVPCFINCRCWLSYILLAIEVSEEVTVLIDLYASGEGVFC